MAVALWDNHIALAVYNWDPKLIQLSSQKSPKTNNNHFGGQSHQHDRTYRLTGYIECM
jgi:hypothetical protein